MRGTRVSLTSVDMVSRLAKSCWMSTIPIVCRGCWYFLTLTVKSASAWKYHCSTSPGSIQGIVFSTGNGGVTIF